MMLEGICMMMIASHRGDGGNEVEVVVLLIGNGAFLWENISFGHRT